MTSIPTRAEVDVVLLHRIDGLLGLARHRGVDDQWKRDADALVSEVRSVIREAKNSSCPTTPEATDDGHS